MGSQYRGHYRCRRGVLRVNQADVPLAFTPTLIDASLPSVPRVVKAVKDVVYVVK